MRVRHLRNRVHAWIGLGLLGIGAAIALASTAGQPRRNASDDRTGALPANRITTVYTEPGFRIDNDGDRGTYAMTVGNSGSADLALYAPTAKDLPPGMTLDGEWPLRLRAHVAGQDIDGFVDLEPPGDNGRSWQQAAAAAYCRARR